MKDTTLLTIGVMSDVHLSLENLENFHRAKKIFQLFKEHNVDGVINCGDTSDTYNIKLIQQYCELFYNTFKDQEEKPEKLFLAAGHDVLGALDKDLAYQEVARTFNSGGLNFVKEIKGYTFIGISQGQDLAILEEYLEKHYQGSLKPTFVLTHEPPQNTIFPSSHFIYEKLRKILNNYPQVINISGHTHAPVFLDTNLWQGEFTAINAGSLFYWKDRPLGAPSRIINSCDAMIFEIQENQIVIHRFNMLTNQEIDPDNLWTLPIPYIKENALHTPQMRKASFPIPQFSSKEATIKFDQEPFSHAYIKYPSITPISAFHNIRVELLEEQDGNFNKIALFDYCNNYLYDDKEMFEIPVGLLKSNCNYKAILTPMNIYEKTGSSINIEFTTPVCKLEELVINDLITIKREDGKFYTLSDGVFETTKEFEVVHIVLPQELQQYRNFNLATVIEFECSHTGNPAILMAYGTKPDWGRHFFPNGVVAKQRHSFLLNHLLGDKFSIFLGEGSPGKYKIHQIKYYKY